MIDTSSFLLGIACGLCIVCLRYVFRIAKVLEEFMDKYTPSRKSEGQK